MKNLVLLGATGSIGTQTLEVINSLDDWNILALSANSSIDLLKKQIKKFEPAYAVIGKEELYKDLNRFGENKNVKILSGMEGLQQAAALEEADLVINALVGAAGLKPSISALKAGNKLGLANKESLVIGGKILNQMLEKNNTEILPVDSEHNAIFNLLKNHNKNEVKNLWLTASGGPFLNLTFKEMEKVTVEQALDHPNWDMGNKITIDSATLMNKGLEVIEAHWLFKQSYDNIKVIIHPESLIHSMVEFIDDTFKAEIGPSDMHLPIKNILTYPDMQEGNNEKLDLYDINKLTFEKPDLEKFRLLKLAYRAGKKGGSAPVVLNATNEIAVNSFLKKEISFVDISIVIEKILQKHKIIKDLTVEKIFDIDNWAREKAREVITNADNNY